MNSFIFSAKAVLPKTPQGSARHQGALNLTQQCGVDVTQPVLYVPDSVYFNVPDRMERSPSIASGDSYLLYEGPPDDPEYLAMYAD
jgi:hypothetical protein